MSLPRRCRISTFCDSSNEPVEAVKKYLSDHNIEILAEDVEDGTVSSIDAVLTSEDIGPLMGLGPFAITFLD
jgi:hypothetical protein